MGTVLLNHKILLHELLIKVAEKRVFLDIGYKALTKLIEKSYDIQQIEEYYLQELENKSIRKEECSYLHAVRSFLESEGFGYYEAIEIIEQMFDPLYSGKKFPYLFALQNYNVNSKYDIINARSEWRAYFEHEFRKSTRGFLQNITQHYLTPNFSLWSFDLEGTLPVYRMHVNLPIEISAFQKRELSFGNLGKLHGNYSFVWEYVRNNHDSIIYFDKGKPDDNLVSIYEIDPDEQCYYGKYDIKCYRNATIIDFKNPDATTYKSARLNFNEEKEYQYSIIKFLIISGIFNPTDAAYAQAPNMPGYKDLLQDAGPKIKTICKHQFNSSKRKLKQSRQENKGQNDLFLFNFKYSTAEDKDIQKLIEYIDTKHPEAINNRIAVFESGFFHLIEGDNSISHIYWFPVKTNFRGRKTGGSIFVNSDHRIGMSDEIEITPFSEPPQELLTMLYFFAGLFNVHQIEEIESLVRPSQERAAAVSIMSRNISHNLGSHVFSYLKNLFSNELQMLERGVLENVIARTEAGWRFNPEVMTDSAFQQDQLVAPYLQSIGRLLGYLQERQDYIGALASGWFLYYGTARFKEQVLDYFCGIQHIKSPNGSNHAATRNLILDYIAFSEGYEASDIDIHSFWKDEAGRLQVMDDNSRKDVEIALPTGNTGRQAVFTILENLLRNTAKHGLSKEKRADGRIRFELAIGEAPGYEDFYRVELTDNGGNASDDIVDRISRAIKSDLTDRDGKPDEQHKGVKEIQIAAGWLRGVEPAQFADLPKSSPPVLDVSRSDRNLCYTFYLRKPKPGLLIVKDKSRYVDEHDKWKPPFATLHNWDIAAYNERFSTNPGKKPYQFIVIHRELEEAAIEKVKDQNPVRVLTGWTEEDLKDPAFAESLYRRWIDGEPDAPRFGLDSGAGAAQTASEIPILIEDSKGAALTGSNITAANLTIKTIKALGTHQRFIAFREHLDTPGNFSDFKTTYDDYLDRFAFVESITGNNSTGRLLRQEEKNQIWALKMREAALTKVLIVDERIWKNLRGTGFTSLAGSLLPLKNVRVLSLEPDPAGNHRFVDLTGQQVAQLEKDGAIRWLNGHEREEYHFVSFHQGLLDRMINYCEEYLKASGKSEIREKSEYLFGKFREEFPARFRHLVHSGRSKTPVLPKGTAFVQLSSLDTALNDCKYTLCELFYASILENEKL